MLPDIMRQRPQTEKQNIWETSNLIHMAVMVTNPSKKCKLWTEQQKISVIEAVKGDMKVYSATREYDVPRMTLQDWISGRVVHGKNPGPEPYLNRTGEREILKFLVRLDVVEAENRLHS